MAELEIIPTPQARIRVAGTVLTAVVISGVLVFLLTGGGRNLFEDKTTIVTYMADVTTLAVKDDVRLSGIPIGTVTKMEVTSSLDPQYAVRIEMRLNSRFLGQIPQDSQTSIGADTPIGYWFVSIAEGKSPIPLARNGTLPSEPLQQEDQHLELVATLQGQLDEINNMLIQISSPETQLGQFVMGDQMYNNVLGQISAFSKKVHGFVAPDSQMGQALFSNNLYNQIRDPLLRTDNMLAAIQRGEGTGGRLFASDEQYNQLLHTLRVLRAYLADLNDGKGQFGSLLHDDAEYQKIRTLLVETDAMIGSLNAGEGGAGRLLENPQLYESLNGSLRSLEELLRDLRENPQKYLRYQLFHRHAH
ncbi:MAG: MlaD family protein [Bryobacteraceae bacterium]|jgi:phospholipid/cholesterol/gamma-HCH transport system substrate-binding protein